MTVGRIVGIVMILLAVGVATVAIRTNQVAIAQDTGRLHRQIVELERELWKQELTIARLRAPERIRNQSASLDGE
jgi:hypothetical protein